MKRRLRVVCAEGETVPDEFQRWMGDVIAYANNHDLAPEMFVFELHADGPWRKRWKAGATPEVAAGLQFGVRGTRLNPMAKISEEIRGELCEALMHLETSLDASGEEGNVRTWAAIQLIQAIVNGTKVDGRDECLAEARAIDVLKNAQFGTMQ